MFTLLRLQLFWEQPALMSVHNGRAAKLLLFVPALFPQVFALLSSRGWHLGDVGDALDHVHDECV